MAHELLGVRLPRSTAHQIDRLHDHLSVTRAQLVVLAINCRMGAPNRGAFPFDASAETKE